MLLVQLVEQVLFRRVGHYLLLLRRRRLLGPRLRFGYLFAEGHGFLSRRRLFLLFVANNRLSKCRAHLLDRLTHARVGAQRLLVVDGGTAKLASALRGIICRHDAELLVEISQLLRVLLLLFPLLRSLLPLLIPGGPQPFRQLAVSRKHITVLHVAVVFHTVRIVGDGATSLGFRSWLEIRIRHLASVLEHIIEVHVAPGCPSRQDLHAGGPHHVFTLLLAFFVLLVENTKVAARQSLCIRCLDFVIRIILPFDAEVRLLFDGGFFMDGREAMRAH